MRFLLLLSLLFAIGCCTEVTIDPIRSWEGHYRSTNEFYNATKDIQLTDDETIWVLSDKTLNRVLKNTERK